MMKKCLQPIVFDLFCGCGGLSLGLEQSGMKIEWANEFWPEAAETYRATHQQTTLFREDASQLLLRLFAKDSSLPRRGDVDILTGGPPCQGFSGFNRHRSHDDPRNSMVEVFLGFVDFLRPRIVLMENVSGMLAMNNGQVVDLLLSTFKGFGYNVRLGVLQAGYYGLPQNRWRVFILASLNNTTLPEFPEPTHIFPRTTLFGATGFRDNVIKPPKERNLFWNPLPTVTVGEAISDLPPMQNGQGTEICDYEREPETVYQNILREGSTKLYDHICTNHGAIMYSRICSIPKLPGAGWLDLPEGLKPKNLVRHGDDRYPNRFGRLHWQGIFNTILTKPYPYWGRVIHPEQDRVLSVRECARAQSFPDWVRFFGKLSDKYKQVGNAVPPFLAKAIGLKIMDAL